MAKTFKRAVSLLLVLLMVATCVWSAFSVQAASDVLFKDDFSSSALSGWAANNVGAVSGGEYVLSGAGINTVTGADTADGVGITADVEIGRKKDPATGLAYGNGTASVIFHSDASGKNYYEFGLGINQKGIAYVFLCLNKASGNSPIIKKVKNISGLPAGRVLENTKYELKVLLFDGKIHGYINDILFCEVADTLKSGKAGLSVQNATVKADNFTLHKLGKKTVTSVNVLNAPAEVDFGQPLGIQTQVQYSGIYGSEILDENAQGLTVTGYTGAGSKTITVTCGGKSDSFALKVNPAKAAQVVYDAGKFSNAEDWAFTPHTPKGYDFSYGLQLGGGKMYSKIPDFGGYNAALMAAAILNKDLSGLTDYSIDLTAKITSDLPTVSNRTGAMDIYFGNNGATLAFRLQSDGMVRVYNGTVMVSEARVSDLALNKSFSVKVSVTSNVATLVLNGATVTAYSDVNMKPYLGIRSVNGELEMSSYKVTDLGARSPWVAKSAVLVSKTGEKLTEYTGKDVNLSDMFLKVTYYTGDTRIISISKDMLSAYEALSDKAQKITVTYGATSAAFTYNHTPYLFYKTFNTSDLSDLSYTHPEWFTAQVKNGKLYLDVDSLPVKENKTSMVSPAAGYMLQDAVVALDFRFTKTHVSSSTVAVQTRKQGSTIGYDLRFSYASFNNTFSMSLVRLNPQGNVAVLNMSHATLLEKLGVEYLDASQQFNLKIENAGRSVFVWLNGKLVGSYYDDTELAILDANKCFIKVQNCSIEIDNIIVGEVEERQIKSIAVEGGNNGVIELYKGFELEPMMYDLRIAYDDGLSATVPLNAEFLTMPESLQVGMNEIPVSYMGFKTTLKLNVLERPQYLQEFENKLAALDAAKITAEDASKVADLKKHYDSLSPIEVKELSQSSYKKYWDIIEALDRAKVPELEGQDLLYVNDFSTPGLNKEEWDTEYQAKLGDWYVRNGYIINEQLAVGVSGTSWAYLNPVYGDVEMIETDMCLVNNGAFASLVLNITDNGYYHARITNKYADSEGKPAFMVQLYKFVDGTQIKIEEVYTLVHDIDLKLNEMCAFRMMEHDGLISVYVNDVCVIQYNDGDSGSAFYEGAVAYRTCENDAKYDNLRIYGKATEPPKKVEKVIEPTVYTDNFEDETVGKDPSHWIEAYDYTNNKIINNWKVMNKGGSKVYGTTSSQATYTWLHAFEVDPQIKAKFMYTGSGKFGVLTRMYDDNSWLAIGYNTVTQKWFIASTESAKQEETVVIQAETATPLKAGEWVNVEVNAVGTTAKVVVNGETVLEAAELTCKSFGRVGLFSSGTSTYVDDVDIKFVNGGSFDDGVIEYSITPGFERTGTHMEIEDLGNGRLLGVTGDKRYLSEDHGTTWRIITNEGLYTEVKGTGLGYSSILNLGNGRFIMIYATFGDFRFFVSEDNMQTWKQTSTLLEPEDHIDEQGNSNTAIIHVNSLTKVKLQDGTVRIFMPVAFRRFNNTSTSQLGHYTRFFYSDDGGYNWKESENSSKDVLTGFVEGGSSTTAEGKILQCDDGSLRYYQSRNDYGNIIYFESKDYGVTWTGCGSIPQMQCAKASFSLGEDPYNPGTYYLLWVSSAPVQLGNIQSRVKISLARTTDGKNWEFLSNIERTSIYSNDTHSYVRQFLDPSITVTEDYVYCTYGRSNLGEYGSTHNNQIPRYVRYEKAKLVAQPWNDATVTDTNYNDHLEWSVMPQTKYGYGDIYSTIGGIVKEVSINGTVNEKSIRGYKVVSKKPNMYKLGKQTIVFANANLHTISYEIEIVPNYDLIWTIKGKGTVDPDPDGYLRMMEGAEQTFDMKPAKGYKVGSVTVNGKKVKVSKNTFTISDVHENQEITVVFAKLTIMDYLVWIILGAVVVAGAAVGVILLLKKKKPKAGGGEMEDISSNSNPPADEI